MTQQNALNQVTKEQAIRDLITPNGKQLGVYHVKNTSLYRLAFKSGGELPHDMDEMFTDTTRAYNAGIKYVTRKWQEQEQAEPQPQAKPSRAKKQSTEE